MAKKILVTGSNSGFGRLIVESCAKAGHTVYATMRNTKSNNKEAADELRTFAKDGNYDLHVIGLDVSDEECVNDAVAKAAELGGGIDIVVNNAGFAVAGMAEATSIATAQRQFDVNFWGTVRVNNATLPYLRKSDDALIIHISSVVAQFPVPFMAFYDSSKFAMEGYAHAINFELNPLGVESVILEPGAYPTPFYEKINPADKEDIMVHYGEALKAQEQMFTAFGEMLGSADAPKSQDIADGVLKLVGMEHGTRPRTTVVDAVAGGFVREAVKGHGEQKLKWMQAMGMA